ncbi:IS66 family insertion sequence element accessory protein TnpB [Mesorhizobium sp. M0189]
MGAKPADFQCGDRRHGQGFCLYYKVLQRGRFPWPSAADGTARLTTAQLVMLWEGIDSTSRLPGQKAKHETGQ